MLNHDKIKEDIIQNMAKLPFRDLLVMQASLAEHVQNIWQYHELQKEKNEQKPQ